MWQTAEEVAATGLHDVAAGRALSIPGPMNKSLVMASGLTQRGMMRRMSGIVRM